MSSGAFTRSRYETDQGNICRIRVQPETIAATVGGTANAAPTDPVTSGFPSAHARGSRSQIGITARRITVAFATPPAGYKADQLLSIPILTPDLYNAIDLDDAVTYLGASGVVVGKIAEAIK